METETKPSLNEGIAEEIRALLARRRLSASDLARMTGLTQRAISRRLTGEKVIDADDLERIADVLDVDVIDLLPIREGRVVTHAGAPRRQLTVPKMGSPITLTKRPTGGRPHGGESRPRLRSSQADDVADAHGAAAVRATSFAACKFFWIAVSASSSMRLPCSDITSSSISCRASSAKRDPI